MKTNKKDTASILFFAALIAAFIFLVSNITNTNNGRELQIVRDAVKNAALTCYAVEGAYPDDVEYLKDHYQLAYDEERYFITYEAFASNRIPDIWVSEKGAGMP